MHRRDLLAALTGSALSQLTGCAKTDASVSPASNSSPDPKRANLAAHPKVPLVFESFVLGEPPWRTFDPFLFCVHHDDRYPRGDEQLAPLASLEGRRLGNDFAGKDGWRMYHGSTVPGFPRHPHRGFETVTLARRGFIDHADSLGATARYGEGDVQWMTAGSGVVHSEMFPLVHRDRENPTELFQIWLNLARADKFVEPHFSMLWSHTIPVHDVVDEARRQTRLTTIAGAWQQTRSPAAPPRSWASRSDSETAMWTMTLQPGAAFELPAVGMQTARTLYFFRGGTLELGSERFSAGTGLRLTPGLAAPLRNGAQESEVLLLQARPIAEPVVQRGPFVMNDAEEIVQAYRDYRRTGFGGWPWQRPDPVHERSKGRFAIHADGREERAT